MIKPERVPYQDITLVLTILAMFMLCIGFIALSPEETQQQVNTTLIEPTPTEVPVELIQEPKLPYDLWKYKNKQYNLSEWYTIHRDDVAGYQDLTLNTTVYRVIEMPNYYTWEWNWGGPTDGSADWANVPARGNKFVFVWVCEYVAGNTPTEDPQIWGLDARHFRLQIGDRFYNTINYVNGTDLTAPIREFEHLYDLSNTTITEPFAIKRVQRRITGVITAEEPAWLRMGRSNAWDGWIMYEVPNTADIRHAYVVADFMHLGKPAYWTITPMDGY